MTHRVVSHITTLTAHTRLYLVLPGYHRLPVPQQHRACLLQQRPAMGSEQQHLGDNFSHHPTSWYSPEQD